MSKINRLKVVIDETVYELTSPEPPEYIHSVASYIDNKIKSIYSVKSEASINPRLKTLFISLNIADDLFKERSLNRELELHIEDMHEKLRKAEREIHSLRKENGLLNEQAVSIKDEIEKVKQEMAEYVEAFDVEESIKTDTKVTKINR